jgi:hypothetical protein
MSENENVSESGDIEPVDIENEVPEEEIKIEGIHNAPSHEELMAARKLTFRDVKQHISGPMVSIVFHILALTFLSSIIVFEAPKEGEDIVVKEVQVDIKELEKIPEPPEPEDIEVQEDVEIERPDVTPTDVQVHVEDVQVSVPSVDIQMPDVLTVAPTNSALVMPTLLSSRSGSARKRALKRYGGNASTELAVSKGLAWLAKQQNPDGSWGTYKKSQYAFTALAALAFFAHGETPMSVKYGPVLIKAITKMMEWTKASTRIGGSTYAHPMMAYAMSEAYGITRMAKVKEAMNKLMKPVVNNINNRGSYYYGYDRIPRILQRDQVTGRIPKGMKPEPRCDLSFAGWNYQALKAAFAAGCELDGLEDAIDLSVKGLRYHTKAHKDGGFGIGPRSRPDFGMTSVGVLCQGLLGDGNSKSSKKGMKWMLKHNANGMKTCSWKFNESVYKEYPKAFTHAIYTWYYQTQIIFQHTKGRGSTWTKWNRAFSRAYVKEQNPDGSWSTPAEKYGTSHLDPMKTNAEWRHVPNFKEGKDLEIYSTTLCVLTLEVYYRYLPTFKLITNKNTKQAKGVEDDDLGLSLE